MDYLTYFRGKSSTHEFVWATPPPPGWQWRLYIFRRRFAVRDAPGGHVYAERGARETERAEISSLFPGVTVGTVRILYDVVDGIQWSFDFDRDPQLCGEDAYASVFKE